VICGEDDLVRGEDGGWVKSLERNGLEAQERLRGKTCKKNELHKINFVLRSDNSTVNAVSSVADRAGDCYMMSRVTRETWCTKSERDPVPWYGMWSGCFRDLRISSAANSHTMSN
jgi:hypothetical protein